jgi:hypothetical protein
MGRIITSEVSTPSSGKIVQTKLFFAALAVFIVAWTLLSGTDTLARTYSTTFPLTENPISEGGNWISGDAVGLDWADVCTTPGFAIGLESGGTGFDDATALLTGTWGSNQIASAVIFTTNRMSIPYEEIEVRLRSSLSPHNCDGYEVLFSMKPDAGCYVQIVRWNGPLGDFTYVAQAFGSQYVVNTGDTISGSISNHILTAYINGAPVLQGTDSTYSSGSPGIGIFIQGASGVNHDYGVTSFTATDGADIPPPPHLNFTGPETNGTFTLQFNGHPGTTYRIQYTDNLNPPDWQPLGAVTANVLGFARFTNIPPINTPRRFYRSVWP